MIGESLHVEDTAEHIAAQIVERQEAVRSEVTIKAKFPVTADAGRRPSHAGDLHPDGQALVNGTSPAAWSASRFGA